MQTPAFRHFVLGIFFSKNRSVSVIGCGQFSFSTICYFIYKKNGNHFLDAYDIDDKRQKALSRFYNFKNGSNDVNTLLDNPALKLLYIVSNHASHTEYALEALKRNIDVYIEKPVSISFDQFSALKAAMNASQAKVYVGYNRPHSGAVRKIDSFIGGLLKPVTLSCFISGHFLEADHWYRKPDEGTRVCGNLGHWLDLAVHFMNKRGFMPRKYAVQIGYADTDVPDDNLSLTITTEYHDLVNILITARTEPFEGINETINLQCGNVIAKIDDFRSLTIWQNEQLHREEYSPKDVGHKNAVNQPFSTKPARDWKEVELSTTLMLHIADMVRNKVHKAEFELNFEQTISG